jgi:hypothetical protein
VRVNAPVDVIKPVAVIRARVRTGRPARASIADGDDDGGVHDHGCVHVHAHDGDNGLDDDEYGLGSRGDSR